MWIFDQSSNHRACAKDALVASKMKVGPGGAQPKMRSTPVVVNDKPFVQSMVTRDGIPKGLKIVLEERGVDVRGMTKKDMVKKLNKFEDFKNEKSRVERALTGYGHKVLFTPTYHPELNPIERVWGKAKMYARDNCDYAFRGLQNIITAAFKSVMLDNIRKYFRKCREYRRVYEQVETGLQADIEVKKYKSHRKVPANESVV